MLISEMEAQLKEMREKYGDLPIMVWAQLNLSYQLDSLKESNVNVRNTDEGTSEQQGKIILESLHAKIDKLEKKIQSLEGIISNNAMIYHNAEIQMKGGWTIT